jgi:mono/diheme cytochrome c family protein
MEFVRGPALLALVCVSGCGGCGPDPEAYPDSFVYPPRQEWIVVELPKEAPTKLEPSGELDEGIQRINERGGRVLDPATVPATVHDELAVFLLNTFRLPAQPSITGDEETKALVAELGLTDERLAAGSKLFRSRCQECHGPTGNGRGPTGPWLTPHPRDFRQGVFKFVSTNAGGPRKPTRSDLLHTITEGLPTTQMPPFKMRTEEERQRLIDYVMFLSIRGRTEFDVLRTVLVHGEGGLDGDVSAHAAAVVKKELREWLTAEKNVIKATPLSLSDEQLAASIQRGQSLFLDAKGGACVTCHANYGREAKLQYDVWGTIVKPGDLTDTRRKGGPEPEQLYRRIHGGIGPSNMPAASALSESQKWDVVNFLRALPYPDRLPNDLKQTIYP